MASAGARRTRTALRHIVTVDLNWGVVAASALAAYTSATDFDWVPRLRRVVMIHVGGCARADVCRASQRNVDVAEAIVNVPHAQLAKGIDPVAAIFSEWTRGQFVRCVRRTHLDRRRLRLFGLLVDSLRAPGEPHGERNGHGGNDDNEANARKPATLARAAATAPVRPRCCHGGTTALLRVQLNSAVCRCRCCHGVPLASCRLPLR